MSNLGGPVPLKCFKNSPPDGTSFSQKRCLEVVYFDENILDLEEYDVGEIYYIYIYIYYVITNF